MRTTPRFSLAAIAGTAALLMAGPTLAQPANPTPFQQRVLEVLQSDARTAEDRARDPNRQPWDTLEFFRMREDMRVIEILPAGGWYTKILAPLLRENGKLYVTHPPGFYADAFAEAARLPELSEVEQIGWGTPAGGGGGGGRGGGPFGPSGRWDVEPVDLIVTFRNYHNFSPADRMTVNKSAFDALRPGGLYGIVDHTRRHMEPDGTNQNGRRVDPVLVIKEVQESGFEFVDYSDALRRPNDLLVLEVGNPEVSDRADGFTLLFRKPE
jgi:predicted methyltransferase